MTSDMTSQWAAMIRVFWGSGLCAQCSGTKTELLLPPWLIINEMDHSTTPVKSALSFEISQPWDLTIPIGSVLPKLIAKFSIVSYWIF